MSQTVDFSDLTPEERELFRKRDIINTLPNLKKLVKLVFGMGAKNNGPGDPEAGVTSPIAAPVDEGPAVSPVVSPNSRVRPVETVPADYNLPPSRRSVSRVQPV